MSLGNGNPKSGDKGSNFNYELKVLQGLQCTCDQLKNIDANTDDVEFILTSILTTLQASTEYEAKFVVDTCNSDTVYLEVRVWNPDTSTWGPITYYLPGSTTPVIPPGAATPGCLVYADPSAVLALILGAIQASNVILTDIETSVELIDNCVGTDGATAPANSFVIAGVTAGGVQQTVEVNASGHVHIADGGGSITVDGGTGVQRTPTFLRPAGLSGTIPAGRYSISFASVGTADATVGGITLKPGETMNFDAGAINNTLAAIAYSTTTAGAELLIISLI
jgi:hypothetical protein